MQRRHRTDQPSARRPRATPPSAITSSTPEPAGAARSHRGPQPQHHRRPRSRQWCLGHWRDTVDGRPGGLWHFGAAAPPGATPLRLLAQPSQRHSGCGVAHGTHGGVWGNARQRHCGFWRNAEQRRLGHSRNARQLQFGLRRHAGQQTSASSGAPGSSASASGTTPSAATQAGSGAPTMTPCPLRLPSQVTVLRAWRRGVYF